MPTPGYASTDQSRLGEWDMHRACFSKGTGVVSKWVSHEQCRARLPRYDRL